MQSVDSAGDKMSNKRKASDEAEEVSEVAEGVEKRQRRRRRRSRSEPRNTGSDKSRREAIHRLFGEYYSQEAEFDSDGSLGGEEEVPLYMEDPLLLDTVPECMDPEQLGFLVCAQETLRFLRQSGMSFRNKVYVTLRSNFVKAIKDIGIA